MQKKVLVIIFGLTLALLIAASHVQTRAVGQQAKQSKTVIFAVNGAGGSNGGASMEPIAILEGGNLNAPVAGDSDTEELKRFATDYYRPGQKYRLLFGGGEAGSVTVKKDARESECFRAGADVSLATKVQLNRNVMALATNSAELGRAQSSRRAPTAAERAAMMRLVKQAYRAKGVPASLLSTLETVNLTATDLDRDGKAELIGSFVAKKTKGGAARYVLFLIAIPKGDDYQAGVSNYEPYQNKDIMSGGSLDNIGAEGIYTERLVDQLDVDGDGMNEVFTVTNGFEGVGYKLYKKQNGKWTAAYEFSSYRCGF